MSKYPQERIVIKRKGFPDEEYTKEIKFRIDRLNPIAVYELLFARHSDTWNFNRGYCKVMAKSRFFSDEKSRASDLVMVIPVGADLFKECCQELVTVCKYDEDLLFAENHYSLP